MGDRAHWVPAAAYVNLNAACSLINKALGNYGCYHVGSSLQRESWNDVDVRFILKDDEFARLFGDCARAPHLNPLWAIMCSGIALWLQKQTGLPVDFQIQQMAAANAEFGGADHLRSSLGTFLLPTPADYSKKDPDR